MKVLETTITIDAPAHTIWSILDDLESYPEWNPTIPEISGRTTVGQTLSAAISFAGFEATPFVPTIIRIVGAREFRWVTELEGDAGYRAEHYFILTPLAPSQTHLLHCESFEGPLTDALWPMMDTVGRKEYEDLNQRLKQRAERVFSAEILLHPAIDRCSDTAGSEVISVLECHCLTDPVQVAVSGRVWHNHLCGCSQCWKPEAALFAQTAIVAADDAQISGNSSKLGVVDKSQKIQRHACTDCGVHMLGEVVDPDHHFYGMSFIHPELAVDLQAPQLEFAGFVSSLIESGIPPASMSAIRAALSGAGLSFSDAFSPEIMDLIAYHKLKLKQPSTAG